MDGETHYLMVKELPEVMYPQREVHGAVSRLRALAMLHHPTQTGVRIGSNLLLHYSKEPNSGAPCQSVPRTSKTFWASFRQFLRTRCLHFDAISPTYVRCVWQR